MKRKELAKEVGRGAHLPQAASQDLVDEVVADILRKLRAGEPIDLASFEGGWEPKAAPQEKARAGKLKVRPAGQQ